MKTTPNQKSVTNFLNSVENYKRRQDGLEVLKLIKEVTSLEPQMWGDSIVGFGRYHFKYACGSEGKWMLTGFSPPQAEPDPVHHGRLRRIRPSAWQAG